ncbi:hypothetical protein EAO71_12255, partial [Streptomyces sp. ms191]
PGDPVLLDALGATADPDLALRGLVRLVEAQHDDERQTPAAMTGGRGAGNRHASERGGAADAVGRRVAGKGL